MTRKHVIISCYVCSCLFSLKFTCYANPDAKRLYEDIVSTYNKLIRPVPHSSNLLEVKFKLRLSQLLDVEWYDYKLAWNPELYGNVSVLYIPGDMIWLPDIVLYNNADGNYQVTIMTKATVYHTGKVTWEPPAIYKSMCQIDVEWFPFDMQTCHMKFGSWTYDGTQVDLVHLANKSDINRVKNAKKEIECIEEGIDLSEYYPSTEWDIIAVPGRKKREYYPCCPDYPYVDITYEIWLRRKTLFYTVNLIVPCIGISFLTVLVFYLPSDSGEKVTLSISILISLTVFFLLLVEIIPSTSLVVPLIGKYLLFTMVLVTLSICVTVIVINFHFRSPRTHRMSAWMRTWFLKRLPRVLLMQRPGEHFKTTKRGRRDAVPHDNGSKNFIDSDDSDHLFDSVASHTSPVATPTANHQTADTKQLNDQIKRLRRGPMNPDLQRAIDGVKYIAGHLQKQEADETVMEDWKFVAMVIDRLFLVLFCMACFLGTVSIICQAPTLWDNRQPIDNKDKSASNYKYC